MSVTKKIAKNTTVLSIATIIGYILGFFTTLYTARYLGAEGFGIISLALSLTAIFGILIDMGLNTLIVREIARNKDLKDKYVSNTVFMKLLLTFLTFGLIVVTTFIFGYSSEVSYIIYIIAFSVIFTAFTNIFYSVFQSYQKMEYQSVGTIIYAVLMLSGVIIAVFYNLNIFAFAFIYFIVSLLILIYSLIVYSWKFTLPKLKVDFSFWKPTLKEALPFAIVGVFTMIYFWIDSVMLSKLIGNEVVGWYNAAYRIVFIFASIYAVYMVAIFPALSEFYEKSKESLKIAYERSFKYMLIINIPIAVATTLLADKIIILIYGNGYIPAIIALQILIWAIIFMFINNISLYLLGSVNRQVVVAKIVAVGAIFNIILNLILIPEFSYVGSSVATVMTELFMLPLFFHILQKTEYIQISPLLKSLPKIIIANFVLIILILFINNFNLFVIILISAVVYLFMIYITGVLDKEDLSLIKELFGRKNNL